MQDEEITLFNSCTDLVSLAKWEAFPLRLLGRKRPGEWIGVREFCLEIGVGVGQLKPELFATWLFYDDESKWSMAAHYNRERLFGDASRQPALQPNGVATLDARAPAN